MKSPAVRKCVRDGKVWTLKEGENLYVCPSCEKTVKRASTRVSVRSFCEDSGKHTRLRLVKNVDNIQS